MKKILVFAALAVSAVTLLTACGSKQCNLCEKSCSAKYSYLDGKIVICNSCYKECFEEKTDVDPDDFFANLVEEAETVAE